MKRLKTKCLLFMALGLWAGTGTKADDVSYIMRVNFVNGTVDEYLVADHPQIYLWVDKVQFISTPNYEIFAQYLPNEIESYTFADASTTNIGDVRQEDDNANICIKYIDRENVAIRNIGSNAPINVYSIDGRRLKVKISRVEDGADVSLSALPSGTYILNIKNKSIKVLKQ